MKRKIVSLVLPWVLSLYPSVGHAQTTHHSALTVKVPFEFVVGNQTFPAGTYRFRSLLNSVPGRNTMEFLMVSSRDRPVYRVIITDVVGSEEPNNPRVEFTRSGGRAFLSEVWEPGKQAGCRLHIRQHNTQPAESENDKVTLIALAERL